MDIFDYIEKSRHKKIIIAIIILFALAVNLIEPFYLLTGGYYNELFSIISSFQAVVTLACVMIVIVPSVCSEKKHSWIILLCLPLIAYFIAWCLCIPINKITQKILWSKSFDEVVEVKAKKSEVWEYGLRRRSRSNEQVYYLYVTSKTTCNHPTFVTKEEVYEHINIHDTIIINVSLINKNISRIKNLHPTSEDIEKCKNEMSLYIDEAKSYIMLATVISKESREENRKHSQLYYAKLRIRDGLVTSLLRIRDPFQNDRQVYESLRDGDTVLVKLTEAEKKSVSVLKWQPTPEDKQKYKTPVKVIERK